MNEPHQDFDAYKAWAPPAQEKALELIKSRQSETWRPFYCKQDGCDGRPHDEWAWNHARADQHPPADTEWVTWLLLSGRGSGKTRTGSEFTHRMSEVTGRIAIVAATGPDARDTMIEGESGLVTIAPPGLRPHFEPSKRRLTWPNGCIGAVFSAEEPDRIRGPEHGYAWVDEPAHFALIQEVWDNLMFGLRIGKRPRVVCTTTPKPRPWLKALIKEPDTRIARASTYDNLDNLAPSFAERILRRYQGTRLGRQELHGEVLEDVEGALWTYDMIEPYRVVAAPEMRRVVVAVDPAGGAKRTKDERRNGDRGRRDLGHGGAVRLGRPLRALQPLRVGDGGGRGLRRLQCRRRGGGDELRRRDGLLQLALGREQQAGHLRAQQEGQGDPR
jgi:hypothetical protein